MQDSDARSAYRTGAHIDATELLAVAMLDAPHPHPRLHDGFVINPYRGITMSVTNIVRTTALCLILGLPAFQVAAAEQWHFVVKNKTGTNITKLEVSQDKHEWGNFDIGDGIGPGEKVTLNWASTTNDEKCHQWIRAKFSDGTWSEATKQDFCRDLDEPIEFSE